jgi:hemerythrin-like domain-containing protein
VILNALRVATGRSEQPRLEGEDAELSQRFSNEHQRLGASLEGIRAAADALATESPAEALARVHSVHTFLEEELLPHEKAEDAELYPVLAHVLGGEDPTGAMSRGHAEIAHLIHRLGRLLDGIPTQGPGPDDVQELRRVLYGLFAVLRLHFAQEDEAYFSMLDRDGDERAPLRGTGSSTGVTS